MVDESFSGRQLTFPSNVHTEGSAAKQSCKICSRMKHVSINLISTIREGKQWQDHDVTVFTLKMVFAVSASLNRMPWRGCSSGGTPITSHRGWPPGSTFPLFFPFSLSPFFPCIFGFFILFCPNGRVTLTVAVYHELWTPEINLCACKPISSSFVQ